MKGIDGGVRSDELCHLYCSFVKSRDNGAMPETTFDVFC